MSQLLTSEPADGTPSVRPPLCVAELTALISEQGVTARRSLRAVLGRFPEEEDLVQEVLTRLVVRLRQNHDLAIGAWTWRVAHNLAVDHLRAKRAIPADVADLDRGVGDGLDTELAGTQLAAAIAQGLEHLPDRQRDALIARASLDGGRGGHAEVAQALGISPKAAESLLARARQSLRREMARLGFDVGPWGLAALGLHRMVRLGRRKAALAGIAAAVTVGAGTVTLLTPGLPASRTATTPAVNRSLASSPDRGGLSVRADKAQPARVVPAPSPKTPPSTSGPPRLAVPSSPLTPLVVLPTLPPVPTTIPGPTLNGVLPPLPTPIQTPPTISPRVLGVAPSLAFLDKGDCPIFCVSSVVVNGRRACRRSG